MWSKEVLSIPIRQTPAREAAESKRRIPKIRMPIHLKLWEPEKLTSPCESAGFENPHDTSGTFGAFYLMTNAP